MGKISLDKSIMKNYKLSWNIASDVIYNFENQLRNQNISFYRKGDTYIINNRGYVNLSLLTSLPNNIEFNNRGGVNLSSLTSLPNNIVFNNRGSINLFSLTSLPENKYEIFKNGGNVYYNNYYFIFNPHQKESKLSWNLSFEKKDLQQVLDMLNEDIGKVDQIYTWIDPISLDKLKNVVDNLRPAEVDYFKFDFTSFYIVKRIFSYGEVYDLIGIREDNSYEIIAAGLDEFNVKMSKLIENKLSWNIATPNQIAVDIIFNRILPYLDALIQQVKIYDYDEFLLLMYLEEKKSWFQIGVFLDNNNEEDARRIFNQLDSVAKEYIFKMADSATTQYIHHIFGIDLNKSWAKISNQENLQNFKKNPYKDLRFNYNEDRGQQINEYEVSEGERTALDSLDMQQIYDTDFFEPDLDQWDEMNKSLNEPTRNNLQLWI